MRKYLDVTAHRKDGSTRKNVLTMSETRLINQILADDEVEMVVVKMKRVTKEEYSTIFG